MTVQKSEEHVVPETITVRRQKAYRTMIQITTQEGVAITLYLTADIEAKLMRGLYR